MHMPRNLELKRRQETGLLNDQVVGARHVSVTDLVSGLQVPIAFACIGLDILRGPSLLGAPGLTTRSYRSY